MSKKRKLTPEQQAERKAKLKARFDQQREDVLTARRKDIGSRRYEPDDLTEITSELYLDRATGEAVAPLRDSKFDWREAKEKALAVRRLYGLMGDKERADKLAGCSTRLEYYENGDGTKRTLHGLNACQSRLCPVCATRKAKRAASRLARVMGEVEKAHKGEYRALFLTLTVENCKAEDLRATLDLLTVAWSKLRRRRCFVRAVRGWFRAIEITYNREKKTYHPHIHALLLVDSEYFQDLKAKTVKNGLYIRHGKDKANIAGYKNPTWVQMWQESLQVGYPPSVRISTVYKKRSHDNTDSASMSAVYEAVKYATKDADFLSPGMPDDEAVAVLRTYTEALTRKRLTACGGWIQEAADALAVSVDAEDVTDLVHGDEDSADALTAETAEFIAVYGFRFRYGDYFIQEKRRNPDYKGPGQIGGGQPRTRDIYTPTPTEARTRPTVAAR